MDMSDPTPPRPPRLLTVDTVAAEDAVTVLRQAADAAGWERTRQEQALARATALWIGREGARVTDQGRRVVQGWFDLEVDLRRRATEVRLAVVAALQENRRRQAAYDDALAAWRDRTAAGG